MTTTEASSHMPFHFDPAAIERQLREQHAALMQQCLSQPLDNEEKLLIEMQREAFELLVKSHLLLVGWHNSGKPLKLQAQALGNALGLSAGALVAQHRSTVAPLIQYFDKALEFCLTGRSPAGAKSSTGDFAGTQGGHA